MTTIKRTATELGLKTGDKIRVIGDRYGHQSSFIGAEAELLACDGSSWPYFKITSHDTARDWTLENVALWLTDVEGGLLFERIYEKDENGFIQNTGTAPELKAGQEIDILYVDGSLIRSTDLNRLFKAENTGEWYAAVNWKPGTSRSQIKAYRHSEDRPMETPVEDKLDYLLSALKAELDAANAQIAASTEALETAKATKAALLLKVEGHGLTFTTEKVEKVEEAENAANARVRGELTVGSVLRCISVSSELYGEHIAGKDYRILVQDKGHCHEFKLQSEDGVGVWVRNLELFNFTVVSL